MRTKSVSAVRKGTYYCVIEFDHIVKGYAERMVPRERRASTEQIAILRDSCAAYLADKAQVIETIDIGNKTAKTRVTKVSERYKDKDNPAMIRTKRFERKVLQEDIIAAKYYQHTEDGDDFTEDGEQIQPWVHMVLCDGSQVDVWAVRKNGKRFTRVKT